MKNQYLNSATLSLLFLFIINFSISLSAQTQWAEIGTEWYYEYTDFDYAPYGAGYFYYRIDKDSTFLGESCQHISAVKKRSDGTETFSSNFTFIRNDSVFLAAANEDKFRLVMDYGLQVGDSISLPSPFDNLADIAVGVDSITTVMMDEVPLKKWHMSFQPLTEPNEDPCGIYLSYVERIGHLSGLFTQDNCIIFYDYGVYLNCYNDADYNIQIGSMACDFVGIPDAVEEIPNVSLSVYPNPVLEILTVQLDQDLEELNYQIMNIYGAIFKSGELKNTNLSLPVHELSAGIYFLTVRNELGQQKTVRFIKS